MSDARSPGPRLRSTWAALALSVFLVGFGNLRLWGALLAGPPPMSWSAIAALFLVLVAVFNLLLQAVALPWVFKPIGMTLLLFTAVTSFFMWDYGVLIDESMIRNVMQTDPAEARDFVKA